MTRPRVLVALSLTVVMASAALSPVSAGVADVLAPTPIVEPALVHGLSVDSTATMTLGEWSSDVQLDSVDWLGQCTLPDCTRDDTHEIVPVEPGATTSQKHVDASALGDDVDAVIRGTWTPTLSAPREPFEYAVDLGQVDPGTMSLEGVSLAIAGDPVLDSVLTAVLSGYPVPSPDAVEVEWVCEGAGEEDAVTAGFGWDHRVAASDVGCELYAIAWFDKAAYWSDLVASPSVTIEVPALAVGVPQIREIDPSTLVADVPSVQPADAVLSYQWLRDGEPIEPDPYAGWPARGTARTLTVTDADRTHDFTVRVRASLYGRSSAASESAPWHKPGFTLPTPFGGLWIEALGPAVGQTIRIRNSYLLNAAHESRFGYQWKRDGVAIAGATADAYVLQSADRGHAVTLSLTESAPRYETATFESVNDVRLPRRFPAMKAKIVGTPRVGRTLRARISGLEALTPHTGYRLQYQWTVRGRSIGSHRSLRLKGYHEGDRIKLRVIAIQPGYERKMVFSTPTKRVRPRR